MSGDTEINYDTQVGVIAEQNVVVENTGSTNDNATLEINTDGDGIETLNLEASGGNHLTFGADAGGIDTLNLNVADGADLHLVGDAAGIETLNIAGTDELNLTSGAPSNFGNLANLDTTGYSGNLNQEEAGVNLDISGSEVLESVLTGAGDDVITANVDNFGALAGEPITDVVTTVDLGDGNNRLILRDGTTALSSINAGELSLLDFSVNQVDNAQTLELINVWLSNNATLNLAGVNDLETLELRGFNYSGSNNNDLTIQGGPDDLTINATAAVSAANANFNMKGGLLTVNDVANLTVNADNNLAIDGGLKGDALATLVLNAENDVELDITTGAVVGEELDALTSIVVDAGADADADVTINDVNGSLTTGLISLDSISVTAQDDATLELNGTNDALASAQAALVVAQDDEVAAQTALATAVSNVGLAEGALVTAQSGQDAALLAQIAAAQAQGVAQGVFNAAEIAQQTAQTTFNGAKSADEAAEELVTTTATDLTIAQGILSDFNAYLAAFTFASGSGAANVSKLTAYILAKNDFSTDQKNALNALIPAAIDFDTQTEFDNYLTAASGSLSADLEIGTLTTASDNAVAAQALTAAELATATTDLGTANATLATATTDLGAANAALATANDDLDDANDKVSDKIGELFEAQILRDNAETTLTAAQEALLAAQAAVDDAQAEGTGFEALETVTVVAEDGDADVELTDVYGAVALDVTAGDDAWIDLDNTNVTSITVTAANDDDTIVNHVEISVEGNTVGNSSLQTITVNSDTAEITLADDVDSLRTLDVSNVATNVSVDASAADFGTLAAGDSVEYLIGATDTVTIDSNINAAETFSFVGDDIGNVVINDFVEGNGADHDIIDLSGFGITQISGLTIVDGGTGAEITAAAFDGTIELTGVTAADIEAGNFLFA